MSLFGLVFAEILALHHAHFLTLLIVMIFVNASDVCPLVYTQIN